MAASNTLAIAKREFRGYFNSAIAYVVVSGVLLLVGFLFFFFRPFFVIGKASCRELFSMIGLTYIAFAPAVTMRLLAEERKSGTIEILLTMPVKDWEVERLGAGFLSYSDALVLWFAQKTGLSPQLLRGGILDRFLPERLKLDGLLSVWQGPSGRDE